MSWRIVVQPDGRYARFSEVVDDFTHINMTREQAFDVCRYHCGVEHSEQKVKRAEAEPKRWNEAMAIVHIIHGEYHAKRVQDSTLKEPDSKSQTSSKEPNQKSGSMKEL